MHAAHQLLSGRQLVALLPRGCRSEMYDQPRYKPYHASGFFEDGTSARPLVAGTVPRRDPKERGKASAGALRDRQDGGQAGGDIAVPGRPLGARARAGAAIGSSARRATASWETAGA